jgi:hypothetical protein
LRYTRNALGSDAGAQVKHRLAVAPLAAKISHALAIGLEPRALEEPHAGLGAVTEDHRAGRDQIGAVDRAGDVLEMDGRTRKERDSRSSDEDRAQPFQHARTGPIVFIDRRRPQLRGEITLICQWVQRSAAAAVAGCRRSESPDRWPLSAFLATQVQPYIFRFTCDTAYSTVHRKKLDKIKREILQRRRSPQNAAALMRLAAQLGRERAKRGKEPTYVSKYFHHLRPLSIPYHGGKDLAPGTKNSILNSLEDDVLAWEAQLGNGKEVSGQGNGGGHGTS